MNRRESIKLLSLSALASGFTWTVHDVKAAQELKETSARTNQSSPFEPAFFTPQELELVNVLVDLIIPADERSGSATDAGVPEFMDFMMTDRPTMQLPMRGGLAWIDYQCDKLFDSAFVDCTDEQRMQLLDSIAYPDLAAPEDSQGVAFFNSFRDLTATGFWSSQVGVEDLQYIGNTFVPEWTGCPSEILDQLDVSHDE
ncbi:MAG: gluconate 2-dehydrogenase subunit 3 family protein [Rhodothermaceae bacterium]|nr:gluconate 2-dehydrogenase subunit 3 family protein [Rhodothermaceae bacterium]